MGDGGLSLPSAFSSRERPVAWWWWWETLLLFPSSWWAAFISEYCKVAKALLKEEVVPYISLCQRTRTVQHSCEKRNLIFWEKVGVGYDVPGTMLESSQSGR